MTMTQVEPFLLEVGKQAPDFKKIVGTGSIPGASRIEVSLSDYAGRFVVLVFYPKDQTPGCTRQLCALRDDLAVFNELNTAVFGVNPDSVESHERFVAAQGYNFPILVDAGAAMARDYGALKEGGGVQRTVYVIDPTGVIIFAEQGMPTDEQLLETIRKHVDSPQESLIEKDSLST